MYLTNRNSRFGNLAAALPHILEDGGLFEDGKLGISTVNLILGIVFILLFIAFFIKMRQNQEETE